MPPWQPADDCNTFADNIDLTPDEKDVQWPAGRGHARGEVANKEVSSGPADTRPLK